MSRRKLSRREFLQASGAMVGVVFLGRFVGVAHADIPERYRSLDYVAKVSQSRNGKKCSEC